MAIACLRLPLAAAASAQRRSPSQKASWLAAETLGRAFRSALAAAALPMLPRDLAAACATSLSGALQEFGEEFHGFGVAADADAADDADEQPALELAGGVAQGLVHGGIRDRLQPIAGHVGEFLVRQERGQRCDGVLGADAGKLAAGVGFLLLGGV